MNNFTAAVAQLVAKLGAQLAIDLKITKKTLTQPRADRPKFGIIAIYLPPNPPSQPGQRNQYALPLVLSTGPRRGWSTSSSGRFGPQEATYRARTQLPSSPNLATWHLALPFEIPKVL